jgi:hypothetical protein
MKRLILLTLLATALSACAASELPPPPPPVETRLVEVPLDSDLTASPAWPTTEEVEAALVGAPPNMVSAILMSFIFRQDLVIGAYEAKLACIRAKQLGQECETRAKAEGGAAPP